MLFHVGALLGLFSGAEAAAVLSLKFKVVQPQSQDWSDSFLSKVNFPFAALVDTALLWA